jgi:hypothetical protein
MTMRYIQDYYQVPAKLDGRVIADGKPGTIKGAQDQYLMLLIDGDTKPSKWHPTWRIIYL